FMAWLSDDEESPASRMTKHDERYVLLDSTVVADSWAELTDGMLSAKINVQEDGVALAFGHAWTGTNADGTAGAATCGNWTDGTVNTKGLQGDLAATDAQWTEQGSLGCFTKNRLICLEQ
ncbi:MAG: hypothetical protein KC492_26355, partial [Myxococcales bacterium]|nr:hypothetical protein [Myxococcales bacterium]